MSVCFDLHRDHLMAERLHSEYLHSCSISDAPSSAVEQQTYKSERECDDERSLSLGK